MRRRKIVRGLFAATIVLSLGPLLAVDFTLNRYADRRGLSEIEAAGQRYSMRAERILDEVLNLLQTADNQKITSCLPQARSQLRRLVWTNSEIDFLGLVDVNGFVMCGEPVTLVKKGAVLPARVPDSPAVEIGIESDGPHTFNRPLVSWTLQDGTRLVARIKADRLNIDAGPNYLRRSRKVDVRLADGTHWYSIGGVIDPEQPADAGPDSADPEEPVRLSIQIPSQKYPFTTHVSVLRSDARQLIRPLEHGAIAAAFAFFVLSTMIAVAVSLRSEDTTADEVETAIKNREFIPYYQPVVDVDTGTIQGCEVLVRWVRSDGTVVSPGAFMQYAENSGAIFRITRQLMEKAAEEVGDLYRAYPDLKISINLFAGHFEDRKIIADTEKYFGNSKIAYDQLVFEVTERFPLRDLEMARKVIAEFHALGVRVALDDVGTGHGGLAYLQKLGIDILKIDKMFIDALGSDHASSKIVDTLVELGSNLGMGIVAEGVETMQQVERLREIGVTAAQGYVFAPPLPAAVYIELTKRLAPKPDVTDEEIDASDDGTVDADADDDVASQGDVDSLFDGAEEEDGASQDDVDALFDGAGDEEEGASQDDVDALFDGGGEEEASQDDVDALFDGGGEDEASQDDVDALFSGGGEEEGASQDDVDALFGSDAGDEDVASQDDVDALFGNDGGGKAGKMEKAA